jgi:hypothetical protein
MARRLPTLRVQLRLCYLHRLRENHIRDHVAEFVRDGGVSVPGDSPPVIIELRPECSFKCFGIAIDCDRERRGSLDDQAVLAQALAGHGILVEAGESTLDRSRM